MTSELAARSAITLDHPVETPTGIAERPGRWIDGWNPEDREQWTTYGARVARRNLVVSVFAEFLGFGVFALWSIVVPQLNAAGFSLTLNQQFWLVSIPVLVGATLRVPYSLAVPRFGGRNFTIASALLLLLPALGLAWAVSDPQTPFGVLLLVASLAGLGGGNFASSMTNISFFYPNAEKGKALGLNAAGGNLGTAAVQLAVPLVITAGAGLALDRAGLMFVPLVVLAAVLAWRLMDNLSAATSNRESFTAALRMRHTWVLSFVYLGTFGSFIGFSGAFPTLLKSQFPDVSLSLAFLGALVGSLSRPAGGWFADRVGGARVTVVALGAMAAGALGAIAGLQQGSLPIFFGSFLLLFVFTGVGNGSVYRMIPVVFHLTAADRSPAGIAAARAVAGGAIGIVGAIGAYGGFLIPRGFAVSQSATGGLAAALLVIVGAYVVMAGVTWLVYGRSSTELGRARV
ncbi:MFS transporter [Barrientosiimonas humi]|uniref:MFS transporter n=1 Tax=Barrientosiimonas humi TaxID=999931 RepID=UPI00370DBEFB